MQTKQNRSLQSFRRVVNWASDHDGLLQAAPAPIHEHVRQLGDVIARIEANAATQAAQLQLSTRSSTDAETRRAAVRNAMRPIAQAARSLQGKVLGISAIMTMPDHNWDNEKLVTAANSMLQNAATFAKTLVDHGLQPDCLETLSTAAQALKSSIDARGSAKGKVVGATKGIRADRKEGLRLVKLLDAGLLTLLKDDHVNLASWQNAKRVTLKGVVGTIVPTAPTTTTPSTTPTATTAADSSTGTTRAA